MPGRSRDDANTDIAFSRPSITSIISETCIQSLSSAIFLLTSDIFVTLRCGTFATRLFGQYPENLM